MSGQIFCGFLFKSGIEKHKHMNGLTFVVHYAKSFQVASINLQP